MQKSQFIEFVTGRSITTEASFKDLDMLSEKFAFCSSLHVMRAISAKKNDRIDQNEYLNLAAVHIQDRSKLYNYILQKPLEDKILETDSNSSNQSEASEEFQGDEAELISIQPLEEEIMKAAVMQLGEIETERSLDDLNSDEENDTESSLNEQPKSFGSWLLALDAGGGKKKESQNRELIEKFIQESPQISPVKAAFFSPSQVGKMSLLEDESFVTETLAGVYEQQGHFKKAATAYKNLMLKYPEKSTYFAALQKKAEEKVKK